MHEVRGQSAIGKHHEPRQFFKVQQNTWDCEQIHESPCSEMFCFYIDANQAKSVLKCPWWKAQPTALKPLV